MKTKLSERSLAIVTKSDLQKVLSLAQRNIASFFQRKPRYAEYIGKERLIVLGQGAALHYLDQKNGVKDFDVWFFYPQISNIVLPYRRRGVVDFGPSKFGRHPNDKGFTGRKIDVMIRSDNHFNIGNPFYCIKSYLEDRSTTTAKMFARKAVIGLYPEDFFGEVLWGND